MNSYKVVWEIDLDADSPQEAAESALTIQRDNHSEATVFDVFETKTKEHTQVDLLDPAIH